MQKLLFLEPIFQSRIWGGTRLKAYFNYTIPSEKTGECWAISGHKNGDSVITNGELKGQTLSIVYNEHKELFNHCTSSVFPLLTKYLDANLDLSVQVHPSDDYALIYEKELGKTECWYILDCKEDAELILGHHAKSKEELIRMIENNEWNSLLRRVKIKPGDFYYVPSGTIHAICNGTLILETQQSSDTTYRVYDYDRVDDSGKKRELHIEKGIEVTNVPDKQYIFHKEIIKNDHNIITVLLKSEFFNIEKWSIKGDYKRKNLKKDFFLVSILDGNGKFLNEHVKKGDNFIVTSLNEDIDCQGNFSCMVSYL